METKKVNRMSESGNEGLNNVDIGNTEENLVKFDKCTLDEHECGFKTKDGFCLQKERCAYQLSEKWISIHAPNEKSTIETILEIEKKHERPLKPQEIYAITPKDELDPETERYIIDFKGNVFDIKKHRIIRRNLKI
jgi:hypothetical protein